MNSEVCQTCSVKLNSPAGVVEITDVRKHMTSPIPCPECEKRSKEALAKLVKRLASERNKKVIDAFLNGSSITIATMPPNLFRDAAYAESAPCEPKYSDISRSESFE